MSNLERSHLQILFAVDERGSLNAAAKSLGLTQSALSHAIKKIEGELGLAVYQREGRRLRLTRAGEYLLEFARRVLPQFEQTEAVLGEYALGKRGTLRIGIECHPCYRWLLRVISPYLKQWIDVDVDVKQKFQFGGIGALFSHEIDLLITPDPLEKRGLWQKAVFDYEHVLVVGAGHALSRADFVEPKQLRAETLLTYPVEVERLDIFSRFLLPAGCLPAEHKVIETTDILLKMVECGRGVTALPSWLVREYQPTMRILPVRLGRSGLFKQLSLLTRRADAQLPHVAAFVELAETVGGMDAA